MRPSVLYIRGQRQETLPGELDAVRIDLVESELGPDAGVEHGCTRPWLGPGGLGRCERGSQEGAEHPPIHHERILRCAAPRLPPARTNNHPTRSIRFRPPM